MVHKLIQTAIINSDGFRYEGETLNGKPHGYGKEYHENGARREYNGKHGLLYRQAVFITNLFILKILKTIANPRFTFSSVCGIL
jgi:hypothetical protein